MKIGIFTDAYEPLISGVVVSIKALRKSLESLGHQVYIVTTNSPHVKKEVDPYVIRIKGVPLPFKIFKNYRWILRYKHHLPQIKALNLDVIHIHTEFGLGLFGIYAKQKLNLPLVYTMHTLYVSFFEINNSFLIKMFRQAMLNYADKIVRRSLVNANAIIFPTQKVLDFTVKRFPVDTNHHTSISSVTSIIPTGLNLTNFYQENLNPNHINTLKNKLNLQDFFVCLYVGRLSPEKEINYLIDAFATLNRANSQTKFLIIGDGPEKKNLIKQAKKLGISDKVIFLGFIPYEQLGVYYQLGDVFINASLFETQGLTYIEALAASLPLIVRYDQVLSDIVKDGQNGFFYYQKDELIHKLTQLSYNKVQCRSLSAKALESVKQYNQEVFGQKMLSVYQQVLNSDQ
ncbi:glycosyltransferase [Candidatus Phytoplasma meliae]|uniref:Glycosyltransferase n=2 Tax=Candidatus Phytoplasma meliae TaxID=1848402 RepID=A0ABS5CXR9_9MOLU|nr:glycosyltransferase [Candidatus Phytoplasma meliae]MBP5835767.1 glycosyltransferase [Candidatus Phytoplasma meliae]